jgi:hypothetical protein
MNLAGALLVAVRGCVMSVSYRKHGSANGNRTCLESVQFGSVESICFILRSVGTARTAKTAPQVPDVAARWQRAALKRPSSDCPPAAVGGFERPDSSPEVGHAPAS